MRTAGALVAAALLTSAFAGPACAQAIVPAKDCNARTAKPAEAGDVAADPAAFAGRCVKLEGWWRDIGLIPPIEAAEAGALATRSDTAAWAVPAEKALAPRRNGRVATVGAGGGPLQAAGRGHGGGHRYCNSRAGLLAVAQQPG